MANPGLVIRIAANTDELAANLKEGKDQIETTTAAMNKMAASFQGDRLIQYAHNVVAAVNEVGGAAKLTEAEQARVNATLEKALEKYAALGREAPAAMKALAEATKQVDNAWQGFVKDFDLKEAIEHPLSTGKEALSAFAETLGPTAVKALELGAGVAALGAAVYELANKAAETGGHLQDMSEKTGMSVPAISRLSLVAQVAGTDIDTLSAAFFMLQKNIGEGSPKLAEGLQKIGLTVEELQDAGVDNYLMLIAEHFAATTDPAARASAAVEIFNKQGREIIPTLLKMAEAGEKVKDIEPWTAEQAHEAEEFEMQMKSLMIHLEAYANALGRDLIGPVGSFIGGTMSMVRTVNEWVDLTGGVLPLLEELADGYRTAAAAVDILIGSDEKLPPVEGDAARALEKTNKALKDREAKPIVMSTAEIAAAERDLTQSLKEQNAEREKAAKALEKVLEIERGIHKEATNYLGLSADENKQTQAAIDRRLAGYKEIDQAHAALVDAINQRTLSSSDYQITKVWEEVEQKKQAFKGDKDQYEQYVHDIVMAASEKEQKIRDSEDRIEEKSKETAEDVHDAYTEAFDESATAFDAFKGVVVAGTKQISEMSTFAATSIDEMTNSFIKMSNIGTPSGRLAVPTGLGAGMLWTPGVQTRQGGGTVQAQTPYIVGERGPELFVPERAGTVMPHEWGGGGLVVHAPITINGSVLSDDTKIARAVGDALMTRLRSLGTRFAAA